MSFKKFAASVSFLQDKTHPGKKMKNRTLGVSVVQIAEWVLFLALVAPEVVRWGFILVQLFSFYNTSENLFLKRT